MRWAMLGNALASICFATAGVHAQSPTTGLAYNTSEAHSIRYNCQAAGSDIQCSFVQVAIRRKAQPADLAEVIKKAKNQFATDIKNYTKNECDGYIKFQESLRRGVAPIGDDPKVFAEWQAAMTATEKLDVVKGIDALVELCRSPSEATYLAFIRFSHEKDTRTCSVSSHTFTQRFRRVDQSENWTVVDSPSGPCGVVDVSRFEKELSRGIPFWNYYARKVVTNKRGELFPGLSCTGLDEREYTYSWRSREIQLGCDYVTFSVL